MPLVLSWYSWCLPLMSANGVTEAFLHASASPRQIATRCVSSTACKSSFDEGKCANFLRLVAQG